MAKITAFPESTAPDGADLLVSVDVSDISENAGGKTKKLTIANLIALVDAGAGAGDLVSTNNLSDVANAATALSNLGGQPLDAVLTATTASFTTADETKLDAIEALADVTDATNVAAAGALMDSEVDTNLKTLVLPATTTITAAAATVLDDISTAAMLTTLGAATAAQGTLADTATQPGDLGTAAAQDVGAFATAAQGTLADTATQPGDLGTAAAQDVGAFATAAQGTLADGALPKVAGGASVENIGAVEENVHVATVATTQAMDIATYGRAVYTMSGDTTFSISNPAPSGKASTFVMRIKGAFVPTLPASFDFVGGTAAAYVGTGEGTSYVGTTEDGGTTYQVSVLAGWA